MIAEGVIYEAGEIFRMLEESDPGRRGGNPGQGQPQTQGQPQSKDLLMICILVIVKMVLVWHFFFR